MIIAGGTYAERCIYPHWDRIFGSGLRSAVAASSISPSVTLHSYVPDDWRADVEETLRAFGISPNLRTTTHQLTFHYLDSLQKLLLPQKPKATTKLEVQGDVVLRFGMMEGTAIVSADRAVYDPQSSGVAFGENGSSAGKLAVIINESELLGLAPGADKMRRDVGIRESVIRLREVGTPPQVVVVKDGLGGLRLFEGGDELVEVQSYAAESYFRIGSGDILATAFAHAWGERSMSPEAAADYAARALAYFVEGARLPLARPEELLNRKRAQYTDQQLTVLGVGDYEVQSLALMTAGWIEAFNGSVLNLVLGHHGLNNQRVDLAIVGTGAHQMDFERIAMLPHPPSVIFWPGGSPDLIRHYFPTSVISADYPSALYHAMRKPVS